MVLGTLFVVSVPIGNLKDITYRAVEVLNQVDMIACEDTRKTGLLCKEYNIDSKLTSYHDHNKNSKGAYLISELEKGRNIAIVSDAGTPGINDPGYNIVKDAKEMGIKVIGVPGATAAINALVTSGLPTDKYCYEGFLPAKKGRKTALETLKNEVRTIILYESVHRIIKTLKELNEFFPERQVSIHREMTKIHEEVINGLLPEVIEKLEQGVVKGEFVIIISGLSAKDLKKEKVNKYRN